MDDTEKKKVLVVDDHPDMGQILVRHVELMGFTPIHVNRGREVLEKATQEKPQLILMDILLPDMDGLEVTRGLRQTPETMKIPVVAVTALFKESDLQRCIKAGCNDYIRKPFSFEELQEKVLQHIL